MGLHVGTSGFAYPEWRPAFYPEGLPTARFLEHYAGRLTACEVNATFYRLQTTTTTARWAAAVPEGFVFAVKAHRGLTHGVALAPSGDLLARFVDSIGPLRPRLGAVLLQLPPTRVRDDRGLAHLVAALPPDLPWAVEFRHDSWDAPEVAEAVAALGGTVCRVDAAGPAPPALPPGPIAYVRLRADRYDDAAREAWRLVLADEARRRDVLCFAKHEGVPAGDPHAGVGLAEWLVARFGGS